MANKKSLITLTPESLVQLDALEKALGKNNTAAIIRAALATADPARMRDWFATTDDIRPGKPRAAA